MNHNQNQEHSYQTNKDGTKYTWINAIPVECIIQTTIHHYKVCIPFRDDVIIIDVHTNNNRDTILTSWVMQQTGIDDKKRNIGINRARFPITVYGIKSNKTYTITSDDLTKDKT